MKQIKEVFFCKYCKKCKHLGTPEHENPCYNCLGVAGRENSHIPVKYEKKKGNENE